MPPPGQEGPPATSAEPPVFVEAVLDPKPWGSHNLSRFGFELPADETIGEALFTAPHSRILSGQYAGSTLGELAHADPELWVGERGLAVTRGQAVFPLLVKVIDAHQDLSIQVHPSDDLALGCDIGLGKTEAWHILAAEPESILYIGLRDDAADEAFALACQHGQGAASRLLRQIPAHPGVTYVLPAGTPHAIGAGTLLYEIQQPSTLTYRLDDWGRVDASGNARPLHLAAGLEALDGQSRPEPVPAAILHGAAPRREFLAATRYFALERLTFAAGDRWRLDAISSPQVLTVTHGLLHLESGDWSADLAPWQTLVVPTGCRLELVAVEPALLLRGWVPDLAREVLAPARAAGIPEATLTALGVQIGNEFDIPRSIFGNTLSRKDSRG